MSAAKKQDAPASDKPKSGERLTAVVDGTLSAEEQIALLQAENAALKKLAEAQSKAPSFTEQMRQAIHDADGGKVTIGAFLVKSLTAAAETGECDTLGRFVACAMEDLITDMAVLACAEGDDSLPQNDFANAFYHYRLRISVLGEISARIIRELEAQVSE